MTGYKTLKAIPGSGQRLKQSGSGVTLSSGGKQLSGNISLRVRNNDTRGSSTTSTTGTSSLGSNVGVTQRTTSSQSPINTATRARQIAKIGVINRGTGSSPRRIRRFKPNLLGRSKSYSRGRSLSGGSTGVMPSWVKSVWNKVGNI